MLQILIQLICRYHSIRIDTVHYCPREGVLADKRKRRSKLNRNAEPEDVPKVRLQLLGRTLRDYPEAYGQKIQFLKISFMTRETCKEDIARAVSLCPNLRYVDLPQLLFENEPSYNGLKQEIQARCPDLRKMTYMGGSERGLEQLASGRLWRNLEVLDLVRLKIDPTILRRALGALPNLRALKISDMGTFGDEAFKPSPRLPPFPAVTELVIKEVPGITIAGLEAYLSNPEAQDALKTLTLTDTGVSPADLQRVLVRAPKLTLLNVVQAVDLTFPTGNNIQPLASTSLQVLHYEITDGAGAKAYSNPAQSFYEYLTSSLIQNGLPALRELYVRDPNFPETLVDLAPPAPSFASDPDNFSPNRSPSFAPPNQHRFNSNNPFADMLPPTPTTAGMKQELVVYSKGLEEMDWNFSMVQPATGHNRRGSASAPRPVSSYGLGENLASPWGTKAGARQSVMVGNGFGGFLAIPKQEDGLRPNSSAGERRRHRQSQYLLFDD